MIFLTTAQSILPIVLLIGLGYLLKGRGMFSSTFGSNISKFIVQIALPASIFVNVQHYLHISDIWNLRISLGIVVLTFIIGYILAYILVKVFNVRQGRRGVLINMLVNDNALFIGLPVQIALFGKESLAYFLVYYIVNTMSLWLVGNFLLEPLPSTNKDVNLKQMDERKDGHESAPIGKQNASRGRTRLTWQKLCPPPLMGFFIGLAFVYFDVQVPLILHDTLSYLGDMVTPLSLVYIGIVLYDAGLKTIRLSRDLIFGIVSRFVLAPCIMIVSLVWSIQYLGLSFSPLEVHTYIVQSAGPVAALLPILTNEAKGDVPFATGLVTISTILFVLVIPCLMEIMGVMGL